MASFNLDIPVRFQHTDPAGMVFYPRYFEMFNQVVEEWFGDGLDCDFYRLHSREGAGIPTVHVEVDFLRPSRLGDTLTFELTVVDVRECAFEIRITGQCRNELRIQAELTLVYTSLNPVKKQSIPVGLRTKMLTYSRSGDHCEQSKNESA